MEDSLTILVVEIASIFNKDFDIAFNKRIEAACIGYRAQLAKQEFDKYGRFSSTLLNSFVLPMQQAKASDCCLSDELECDIMRTKDKVPKPIRTNRFPEPFTFVGTAGQEKGYSYGNPEDVQNILEGTKFVKTEPIYCYYNDYIFVFNSENGKLGVRAAFANPLELLTLMNCDNKPCIEGVNIDKDMGDFIKRKVLEEFGISKTVSRDNEIKINEL